MDCRKQKAAVYNFLLSTNQIRRNVGLIVYNKRWLINEKIVEEDALYEDFSSRWR